MAIHFFDVDYTLLRSSTSWYVLLEALKRRVVKFRQLRQLPLEWLRYKTGRIHQDFIEIAVKRLAGLDRRVLEELAQVCFETRLKTNLYREGLCLIGEIRRRGEPVYLASSSIKTLLEPLERFLAVDGSLASVLEFSGGTSTGRLSGKALFGPNKLEAVRDWLEQRAVKPEDLFFYSDSYTDLPLLEFSGHPVAVNPDRFLRREARRRRWQILRWRETLGASQGACGTLSF
ncbi:MAG: HAD-IB family hydrolase [Treponema sp.]|jgi:HAD superfamily hydrolase (TIGR01490 family)|nr:HAD-IB family hydrolase [Treponema sp.]